MSSTVLLVDAELQVRPIIERHLEPAHWTLIQVSDSEQALQAIKDRAPALIVLNVDIAKGWPLCTQLKRQHAAIPVIVVSFRLGKDVFNNHQKLDTRADAYHRLPEELEMLEISLGYFSSHRSETDEDSAPNRRARRGGRVPVPTGIVQRLEATVAEHARALEDAKRQIEALEVERDAVAEKNRRQMLELMAVGPSSVLESVGETQALRTRIAALEAEQLASARREEELRDLRTALATANATLAQKTAEVDRIQGERGALEVAADNFELALDEARTSGERTRQMFDAQLLSLRAEKAQLAQRVSELEESNRYQRDLSPTSENLEAAREAARREASDAADQLAEASVQLSTLANQLTQAHQLRSQADKDKRAAEERVAQLEQQVAALTQQTAQAAAQQASAGDDRLEELQQALADKAAEAEQHLTDKKSIEQALSTSRRLMREYATDAARKAEELKHTTERTKELEQLTQGFAATKAELVGALEFEKSLVESLEKDLATARQTAVSTAELDALRAQIAAVEAKAAAEKEAARIAAADDIDTLRIVAQSELDDARNQAQASLDALRSELAEARAQAAEALASVGAEQAAKSEIQAERERVMALHASEREALATHVTTVHTRFEALVAYARALESRLVDAESRRGTVEARLEELLGEVRSQALSGEIPPPMDLPSAPELAAAAAAPLDEG